jgi:hypothetical protein
MKKVILTAMLALAMVAGANAQFKLGPTVGLNMANLSGDVDGNSMKMGFKIGAAAEYSFNDNWSIAPELAYSAKGTKYDFFGESFNFNLDYLELPINAMFRTPLADDFNFVAFAGPYLAYALSAKMDGEKIDLGSGEEELSPFDFGLNFGIGAEYKSFFLKAQYQLGLTNLSNVSEVSMKNNNIGISVGYIFNLGN